MSKPGVMFYFEIRPCIKRLTREEKGLLFDAILDYAEFGEEPDVDGAVGVAWDFIQPKLDRDAERYDRQVEQKQYAVFARDIKKKGGTPVPFDEWKTLSDTERDRLISADIGSDPNYNPQTTTSNPQTTTPNQQTPTDNVSGAGKPPKHIRFVPPKENEVREYCQESGLQFVDPEQFVNFYQSKGWKVGKESMRDWRAAVRGWNSRDKPKPGKKLLNYEEGETWTL